MVTFLIAEIGINHNRDLKIVNQLINLTKEASNLKTLGQVLKM